jgi:hypothetical protein
LKKEDEADNVVLFKYGPDTDLPRLLHSRKSLKATIEIGSFQMRDHFVLADHQIVPVKYFVS